MRIKRAVAVVGFCLSGLLGTAGAAVDADASAKCLKCHEGDLTESMSKTAHGVVADRRTPTCVSCHGASDSHAADPVKDKPQRLFSGKSALAANEASGVCLACHDNSKRALWPSSAHPAADVACSSCHKVHVNRDKTLSKVTESGVCFACHKEQRALMNRPSRHPIAEGKMTCSDCHDVHGTAGPKLAKRDSTNDTCYTCHAEKRGPFVHSHQPVTEDCSYCHNPHGSTIAGMLKARPPILCNQCHTPHVAGGVGAIGGQPGVFPPKAPGQVTSEINATANGKNVVNIWQGRSCMNCHTQVHGSNNPSTTNPTPQLMFR